MVQTAGYSEGQLPERVAALEAHLQHLATKEDVQRIAAQVQSKMTWIVVMFLVSALGTMGAVASAMLK